jgi:hypothetical protein
LPTRRDSTQPKKAASPWKFAAFFNSTIQLEIYFFLSLYAIPSVSLSLVAIALSEPTPFPSKTLVKLPNPSTDMPAITPPANFEPIPLAAIQLRPDQLDRALTEAQQTITSPLQLWQTYLTTLAQLGFKQWMQERAADLTMTALAPGRSDRSALRYFTVNDFKLCLLTTAGEPDITVAIPQVAVNGMANGIRPHFYVLAAVHEEQGSIELYGLLRQDQLAQRRSQISLTDTATYEVPLYWFEDVDMDALLLYLRCAEPAAFEASISSSRMLADLTQTALNTALWFGGELDAIAQQLAWILLPPPQLSAAMRSSSGAMDRNNFDENNDGSYDRLIRTLQERGVGIPSDIRPAYRDVTLDRQTIRLYALPWQLEAEPNGNDTPEWSLVLILGPVPGQTLPRGIRMVVADQEDVLVETQLADDTEDTYLFAELVGELHEVFWVTLQAGSEAIEVLPAFGFQSPQ